MADTLVDPIGQPDITITGGEEDGALSFDAEVEVRPEVELVGYRDLRVTIPSPNVTDEEVDAQIDRFRETDAILRDVDRPIVTGDLVTMDLRVTQVATDVEPMELSDYMYTVGSGSITEGVDELILGLRAGEDLKLNGSLERGVVATYELHPQAGQGARAARAERRVGRGEHRVGDRRRDARGHPRPAAPRRIIEAQMSQRDATLVALGELVAETAVPETLVDAETNERLHDLGHRLAEQNLSLETFLTVTNQSPGPAARDAAPRRRARRARRPRPARAGQGRGARAHRRGGRRGVGARPRSRWARRPRTCERTCATPAASSRSAPRSPR